jgi:two-component system phosphate regulon sensor histidine kinase PhoR
MRELRVQRGGQRVTYQAVAVGAKSGGVLLVLRNVSVMAAAVQMKTDFVANASHELRTPLSAISAAFETLRDVYTEDPEQSSRCIAIIAEHLRRLEEMLRDLLDLSRVESPDLKPHVAPLKLPELVAQLRATMGPMARQKAVQLDFSTSGGAVPDVQFRSDRRLVDLVLKNLIDNAIKFTPAGGKITVNLAHANGGPNGTVLLEVRDTGIGIPPEHRQRVFERFYQVDTARSASAGRGTGLGLAIVKHAVHALGGSVELTSAVGVGTTVTCTLPSLPAAEQSAPQLLEIGAEADRMDYQDGP